MFFSNGINFLVKYDPDENVEWAKNVAGEAYDYSTSVAVDPAGNIYLSGLFSCDSVAFSSFIFKNTGQNDAFLVKYSSSGNVIWATNVGGPLNELGYSVAADRSGNVYLAGMFTSPSVTIGTYTLNDPTPYHEDLFLAKYDVSGNVKWAKNARGINDNNGLFVTTDPSGSVFVTGSFYDDTLYAEPFTLISSGYNDIYLLKYDASGNVSWAQSYGGKLHDIGASVASDAEGNAYLTGSFKSSDLKFGSYTLKSSGGVDIFLAKLKGETGEVDWATSIGDNDDDYGNSVATDATGNILVAGRFFSPSLVFGSDTLKKSEDYTDVFLAKSEGGNTGIKDPNNSLAVFVYPNPAGETVTLEFPAGTIKSSLKIFTREGREILHQEKNGSTASLNIGHLRAGIYYIRVIGEINVQTVKLIKL